MITKKSENVVTGGNNVKTENWANEVFIKLEDKMEQVVQRNTGKIPYTAMDGIYDDRKEQNIFWWTNGFYAGELWQLYHATEKTIYRTGAEQVEELLDQALEGFEGLHHDVGFMWLHTAVANNRLTGNQRSRVRGLHAATLLAGRFNMKGQFIRAWNLDKQGWMIIDSMMNIPLLYWASKETKDPRFAMVANAHADTVLNYLVKDDGAVGHIASFDPISGEFLELIAGQGYAPNSAWSRGQAWAIYGFALAYANTKEKRYLSAAKKIANYFIANVAQTDYLPLVDFRAPKEPVKWDMSAGTCAACGMLEIVEHVDELDGRLYKESAEKILRAIEAAHANWRQTEDGIIQYSSHSYHQKAETHVPIIYGDYFFIEGILRMLNKAFQIW